MWVEFMCTLSIEIKQSNCDIVDCLAKKYLSQITKNFTNKGLSIDLAEDLSQEVFVKLRRNEEKIASIENLGAWIWTIAENTRKDYFRSKCARMNKCSISDENILAQLPYDEQLSLEDRVEVEKIKRIVHNGLSKLEAKDKKRADALRMYHLHGCSIQEVMEYLGKTCPKNTSTYLNQSLGKLELHMENSRERFYTD